MTLLVNIIAVCTCILWLSVPAILNIICYPFSKKACVKISDYIVKVCAPGIFSVFKTYIKFNRTFTRETEKLPEQFFVISNHQSLLDIPIYMTFFPEYNVRFVAKDALARHIPLVSEMLRSHDHCMIPRKGGAAKAMKTIEDFGKRVVERNQIPVLFPEGTRSKDGTLGTFYSAGFRKLVETTKLPIVVCALDNGYKINDLKHVFENLSKINYKCKVLKVYPYPETKEEQVRVLEEAKELVQKQLDEWREEDKLLASK